MSDQFRYDVVVVGGGIHGAGVAQAAAQSGYRTLLLEKREPAAGTSSRSSKLIHGGLRYLESGRLRLVRESLRERELLLRNAPGLVRRISFLIPIYVDSSRRPWEIRLGLSLYALLGGFGLGTRFSVLPLDDWPQLGGLRLEGLEAVFAYWDAQTDDAQLTHAVIASAEGLGAEVCYPATFLRAQRIDAGFRIGYTHDDAEHSITAQVLVNASGPWVNEVQGRIDPPPPIAPIDLVQGTHLHFDQPIRDSVFYVEAPEDRRPVFVLPWRGGTLVGTTETPYRGNPDEVTPLAEEVRYLTETLRYYFPSYTGRHIASTAGLRVLLQDSGKLQGRSRETTLLPDESSDPHLIAVYGGKLTGYRATAERIMRMIAKSVPPRRRHLGTRDLPLQSLTDSDPL